MKFKDFLEAVTGEIAPNASDDMLRMLGKLNALAEPEGLSREDYDEIHHDVLGDVYQKYDVDDIGELLESSKPILPQELQDNLYEDSVRENLINDAVQIAEEYRPACLVLGLSDAIYNMTEQRIAPSALVKDYEIGVKESSLLSAVDDLYGESFTTASEDEDVTEEEDDEYDEYYDAD